MISLILVTMLVGVAGETETPNAQERVAEIRAKVRSGATPTADEKAACIAGYNGNYPTPAFPRARSCGETSEEYCQLYARQPSYGGHSPADQKDRHDDCMNEFGKRDRDERRNPAAEDAELERARKDPAFMSVAYSVRRCASVARRDEAMAGIKRERANARKYGGVLKLTDLHDFQETAATADEDVKALDKAMREKKLKPRSCKDPTVTNSFACVDDFVNPICTKPERRALERLLKDEFGDWTGSTPYRYQHE
jgi:hypothetical protein